MYRLLSTCLFLVAVYTSAQTRHSFYNRLKNVTRTILNQIIDKNIVQNGSIFAARAFGNGQDIPTIVNSNNIVNSNTDYDSDGYKAEFDNEDAMLNIEELLIKYGYPVEKHQVITEDGYVLSIFRIPNKGVPVFLMHGLTGSADDFILAGPVNGLAYLLANEGFDVWMGNARGNKFSRQHIFFKPSQAKFWDFSWHEIGYYDLPAMIDYALKVTGQKSVKYIGHSQGTTTFFVMASERPQYNKKVEVMIALSPVAFLSNTKSPIVRMVAAGTAAIHAVVKNIGTYEFTADTTFNNILKAMLCTHGPLSNMFCSIPLLLFMGVSIARLNITNLPVLIGHMPSGASAKQFAHFGQEVLSGKFRQFDYGLANNLNRYGVQDPPEYKLKNIITPVILFYSAEDWLAQPKDVEKLYSRLSNVVEKYNLPMFNHLDFLLAMDFKTSIYPRIHHWLKYSSSSMKMIGTEVTNSSPANHSYE